MRRASLLACMALFVFPVQRLSAESQNAQQIYWTGLYSLIQHANTDGTLRRFYNGLNDRTPSPADLVIDAATDTIYWNDSSDYAIRRGKLDGTSVDIIYQATSTNSPTGITLDPLHDKLYWVTNRSNEVVRSNSDGTSVEVLFEGAGLDDLRRIQVDPIREKIYWTDVHQNAIYWANTDGSMASLLIDVGYDDPESLAVDLVHEKLYWTTVSFDRIQRANLDGTNVETVITQADSDLSKPVGLTVDPIAEKMYWIEIVPSRIRRANLDGTERETILTSGLALAQNLALYQYLDFAAGNALRPVEIPEPTSLLLVAIVVGIAPCRKPRRFSFVNHRV